MKLKDIFKVALVGTAGWIGGKYGGATGKKIGTALGQSLMSRGSGTGGEPASAQYVRPPNLSRFDMPTYASGSGRSDMIPGSLRVIDGIGMNALWERRLDKYLLRKKAIEQTIVKV